MKTISVELAKKLKEIDKLENEYNKLRWYQFSKRRKNLDERKYLLDKFNDGINEIIRIVIKNKLI